MASAVSVPDAGKKLKNNINVHSGDDDDSDAKKRTDDSSEDLSENEIDSGKGPNKQMASSAEESEDKESEPEEEEKPSKKEPPKKESKPKKPKSDAPAKRNGTAKELATLKSPPLMLDTNAAEQVKSEGRRERKQVERFSIVVETPEEKAIVIREGEGTKLGEIPFVADQINRNLAAELVVLHRLFFGRRGSTNEIKRNLRQFSGFGIEEGSPEYQKKKANIAKWDSKMLKKTCDTLGLLKKGTKEQVVERIIQFCMKPTDNGLKPKVKVKKSKSGSKKSSSPKGKSSQSRETSRAKPKPKSKSKSKAAAEKKSKVSDASDEDLEKSDEEDKKRRRSGSDDEEEDEPPKKKKVRESVAATPSKRGGPTRQAATGKRYVEDEDGDESEPERIPKKKSTPVKRSRKDSSDEDGGDDSKSESEQEAASSDDEKRKKKPSSKSKGGSSSSSKKPEKKTPVAPKPKSKPKKAKVQLSESESDGESDKRKSVEKDDDSSAGEQNEQTLDEQIKSFLVNRVKNADLKKITIKTLMQDVCDKFPSVDLAEKKSYIKACVNEILEPST